MASLVYTDASGVQCRINLTEQIRIGRHPAQDIQLLDRVVSKEHAVIEFREGEHWVTDIGSRNGTFFNGEQVHGTVQLNDGDTIDIGSSALVYHAGNSTGVILDRLSSSVQSQVRSAIQSRVSTEEEYGFLPESSISENSVLREDYEKLRIANELNQALSLEYDLGRLLDKILDRAFSIFKCDRGVILIEEEEGGEFVPKAARLRDSNESFNNIRISETILKEVVEKHQAILSSDAMVDSRFVGSNSIIMEGIRSTMSVPLPYKEKLLGIIHLDSQVATGAFSDKDLHLLSGFARQAAVAIEHAHLVDKLQREALSREKLRRLLPPALVEEVLEGRMELRRGGDLKFATVMFADIRGFTPATEQKPPKEIVTILNEYFEIMVDVVFQRGGTLDKFMGDGMMAIWGAPFEQPEHAQSAVIAAIEMQQALVELNETRVSEDLEAFKVGIGLNTGDMVAGYMGSSRSMSYTVVSDAVNVASRICDLAGPGEVIITGETLSHLKGKLETELLPPAKLKGKSKTVDLYKVLGFSKI